MIYTLDIGSSKVCCVAAEAGPEGEVLIAAIAESPCKGVTKGIVSDLDLTSEAIGAAVRGARTKTGQQVDKLFVSVSGAHLEGRNAQGYVPIVPKSRPISREDVLSVINHSRQMIETTDREQLQAIPREFRVDGQRGIGKPIGLNGSRLEVVTHIISGQTAHLQNIDRAVTMAGFKVTELVSGPLASGLGVANEDDAGHGVAVVDLGAQTTSVAIFVDGAIAHSAVIPLGGAHVTADLHKLLKTSPEEAERLKKQHGGALSNRVPTGDSIEVLQLGQTKHRFMERRVLCEIIECRMKEIAALVQAEIDKGGYQGLLPAGILLTGGGSQLGDVPALFESVMKHVKVRTAPARAFGPAMLEACRPEAAVAVGLANFALEPDDEEFAPASGFESLRVKIRSLKAIFSTKI